MAANYQFSKETTNFARICRLVIDIIPDLLQDLLITQLTTLNATLSAALKNQKGQIFSLLNKQQKKILYPQGGVFQGSVKNLDISLLYILLRNVGNIPPHQNGWGILPNIADRSLSANIDRLRKLRNEAFAHASDTSLSDGDFQAWWNIIRRSVKDIQNSKLRKGSLIVAVDNILTMKMDDEIAKYYIEELLVNVKDYRNEKMHMEDPEKPIPERFVESHNKSKRANRLKQSKSRMVEAKITDSIPEVFPGSCNNSKQARRHKWSKSIMLSRSRNNSKQSSRLKRSKSEIGETEIEVSIPEICPGSRNNSKRSSRLKRSKSRKSETVIEDSIQGFSPEWHNNSKRSSHRNGTKSDMGATKIDNSIPKVCSTSHLNRFELKIAVGATEIEDFKPEVCPTSHRKKSKSGTGATEIEDSIPKDCFGWQNNSKRPIHRNSSESEMGATKIEDSIPEICPASHLNRSKSEMGATEIEDSISEDCPGSYSNSKQASKFGMVLYRILVMTIIFEILNSVAKNDSKEEKVEEKTCEKVLSSKFDLRTSSKLHSLMNDTITRMSSKKGLKNFSSEMQIHPEILLDMYPVYGPGVGPAIDLLLSTTPPPTRQELMANESLRLCTFHNYPAFRIVSCLLMAKAGFFYTGHNDEVICYSCDKSIAGWNLGSDPYKVHKENSPDCNHLRAMDTYNMSVAAASAPKNSTTAAEAKPDNSATESAAKSVPSNNATSFSSKADTGYNTQTTSSEFVETAGFKFGGPAAEGNNTSVPAAEGNNTSVSAAEGNNTSVPAAEGNYTSVPNSVDNSSISSVGNDRNSSSVPSTINSSLPNSSNTNSAGIQDTSTPVNNYPTQPSESTGRTPVATPVSGYKGPANPQRTRAYYPDYVLPGDRLKTFDKWPADIRQTPKQMLESGFFYAGYEDCVRCFQCGIGLRNWEPPDNPHVEHARWSPRCPFLLQAKGSDFINLVMDAVAQLEQRKNDQTAGQSTETTTQSSNNNTVVTTSENQQNSASASGSSVDNASITPSGTPTDTSNPSPSKPPSNTPAAASKATPSASQGVTAAGKDMKGTDMSNPTLSEPPSATPAAASKHTPSSSPSITAAGKDLKGAETVSTKHNITVDDVSTTNVVTGSDKAKDLTDLMKTEIVRKIKQDGYGEDNVKAALRILLDTKEATDITEAMIYDTVRKNTSVRHRRTALGGEAAAEPLSEELQRIKKENREMRERTVCKICLEDQVSIAFIPCGHLVACGHCAHAITRCAVCRKPITSKILTHMDV